jgi:hypothetical protein
MSAFVTRYALFIKTVIVASVAIVALSGCAITAGAAAADPREMQLKNGGKIQCVVLAGSSGTAAIDCIEASYEPPVVK